MSIKATSGALLLAKLEESAIAQLWDAGLDTAAIARRLRLKEHAVYSVVISLREERHALARSTKS